MRLVIANLHPTWTHGIILKINILHLFSFLTSIFRYRDRLGSLYGWSWRCDKWDIWLHLPERRNRTTSVRAHSTISVVIQGGKYSLEFLVRVHSLVLKIFTLFQTKTCYFALHLFSGVGSIMYEMWIMLSTGSISIWWIMQLVSQIF